MSDKLEIVVEDGHPSKISITWVDPFRLHVNPDAIPPVPEQTKEFTNLTSEGRVIFNIVPSGRKGTGELKLNL